jgi:hypothetical protein
MIKTFVIYIENVYIVLYNKNINVRQNMNIKILKIQKILSGGKHENVSDIWKSKWIIREII